MVNIIARVIWFRIWAKYPILSSKEIFMHSTNRCLRDTCVLGTVLRVGNIIREKTGTIPVLTVFTISQENTNDGYTAMKINSSLTITSAMKEIKHRKRGLR